MLKIEMKGKHQFSIDKQESTDLKHLNDTKAFIKYSNDMDDIYKNIEERNPNKKRKILAFFDDLMSDILSNEKLNLIVTELSIRDRNLNIFLFLLCNLILLWQKNIRLNSTHYLFYYENSKQTRTSTNCI